MNKYLNPINYLKYTLSSSIQIIAPILRRWEIPFLEKYGHRPLKHQPVFIIGAPRTGSTILYQTLTNLYDVLYIDNLVCKFNRNFFFGFFISHKVFGKKPHNNYEAHYGNTKGLHSPSECGQFWYRWLPKDHHFIDYDEITPQMIEEIRQEITTVINYFDRPLVFNNNNAGLRIRLITSAFPHAKWIVCDRKPLYVAQSLLRARRQKSGGIDTWFSILPPNYKDIMKKDIFEQPVLQHYYINKQIYSDLYGLTDKSNWLWMEYEKFSSNYKENMDLISTRFSFKNTRNNPQKPDIKCKNNRYMEDTILNKIENCIRKLNWNDYSS